MKSMTKSPASATQPNSNALYRHSRIVPTWAGICKSLDWFIADEFGLTPVMAVGVIFTLAIVTFLAASSFAQILGGHPL